MSEPDPSSPASEAPKGAPPSTPAPTESSRRRILRRVGIGAAGLFVVYLLVGFFVLPRIVESQLVSILEDQLGVEATVEDVRFDPLRLRLSLLGFSLPDPTGAEPAFAFEEFAVDVRLLGFLSADLALDEVLLRGPRVSAVVDASGKLNFATLLEARPETPEEPEPEDASDEPLVIDVRSVRIERGDLRFVDASQEPPFDVRVEPLDLDVKGFSTRMGDTSPYSLELRVGDDTKLVWDGTFGVEPIHSKGAFTLTGFDLRLPWDYLSPRLRFEVAKGRLGAAASYELDMAEGLVVTVTQGRVELDEVEVLDPEAKRPALTIDALSIGDIAVGVDAAGLRSLSVDRVALDGGSLATHLDRDGQVRLVSLLEPIEVSPASPPPASAPAESKAEPGAPASAASSAEPGAAAAPGAAPQVRIEQVSVENFDVRVEDRGPSRPVPIELSKLSVGIARFDTAPGTKFDLTVSSGVGDGGRLSIVGPVGLDPLDLELAIEANRIGLTEFEPYLDDVAQLDVSKGALSGKLELALRPSGAEAGATRLGAKGSLRIDDLMTLGRAPRKPFVGFERLELKGLDYSPERVGIGEVVLAGARAHYAVGSDGRSNVDAIFGASGTQPKSGSPTSSASQSSQPSQSAAGPAIEVARVTLSDLHAEVDDASLDPPFVLSLGKLSGTVEGLSSKQGARAKVALEGLIDGSAPVRVDGQINPLSGEAYTDIAIVVRGVNMPAFTPYSGRYVGYRIDRGKLGLDLKYKLNAKHLEAQNNVRLEQFNFGKRVESEQATSLPVPLAVAVMKNPSGDVEIALPIEGDIDDPSFSLLGLLTKAVVNLITRVATAPFAVVAGLVASTADDLQHVDFPAGRSRWVSGEEVALGDVAELLSKRASLRLEIRGRADPAIDGPGLRVERIDEALRIARFQALSRRERERVGGPDAIEFSAEERLDALERLYRERIGGRLRDRLSPEQAALSGAERTAALTEVALAALTAPIELGEEDFRALARNRAAAVQAMLLETGRVTAERVFVVDVEIGSVGKAEIVSTELSLRAG